MAEAIKEQVIHSEVIGSDETSVRVKARNWWHWVFVGGQTVFHKLAPTRSAAEIKEVMGPLMAQVRVSDCYRAQLNAPAEVFQLCLAHQLRDLQKVVDAFPKELRAHRTQQLLREAIHLRHRFESDEMSLNGFLRRVTQIENKLDRLLAEKLTTEAAQKLQNRFRLHRDKLLTFLHYPTVPPTNNESEQALRSSVIHRKVTNGFRSEWGAKAYAALQTIIATAKRKGERVFQTLVALMGTPVLQPSTP